MSSLHIMFRVADATYVVAADDVVVMESFEGATRVPGAAEHVAGLVQIRGAVVPVVDLRARFRLPPAEPTLDTRVVVVQAGARRVGLLVDSARDVVRIAADAFQPPPAAIRRQASGFVKAVAQVAGRLVMLIDHLQVVGEEQGDGDGSAD